jgi:hypothetical protein
MTEEHQIATDDEKRDDLSSPVAESRELAILRSVVSQIEAYKEAANDRIYAMGMTAERRRELRYARRMAAAAIYLGTVIETIEQAVVSRYGNG